MIDFARMGKRDDRRRSAPAPGAPPPAAAAAAWPAWWLPAGLLFFVECVAFGVFIERLGFYHDDWCFLEQIAGGTSYWETLRVLLKAGWLPRPITPLLLPLLGRLGGLDPLPYHVALMLADAAWALACYAWLARLTRDRATALLAAAFCIVYPIHPASHYWFADLAQPLSLALAFASLAAHVRWLDERRGRDALLAGGLFAASFLTYECAAFLPALAAVGAWSRRRDAGMPAGQAAKALPWDLSPFLAAFGVGLAWQWLIVRGSNPKHLALSARWTWNIYTNAARCLTTLAAQLAALCLEGFLKGGGRALLSVSLLASAAVGWSLTREPDGEPPGPRAGLPLMAALAVANFAASYLPYALSGEYPPQVIGVMSRTNGAGAFTAALLLAALLPRAADRAAALLNARPRVLRAVFVVAALAPCVWADWYTALRWADSWTLQNEVLDKVAGASPRLPAHCSFLLAGVPAHKAGVEVFHEHWGFAAAFRIRTGRKDVRAMVLKPGMRIEPAGVVERYGTKVVAVVPYDNLYQYDYKTDRVAKVVP